MPCKYIKQLFSDSQDHCKRITTPVPQIIFVLMVLLILMPQLCLADMPDNPHHFQMSCSSCHSMSDNNETVGQLLIEVDQACGISSCHDVSSPANHPVGVIADERSSSELPLDDKGKITCITCHDELNNYSGDLLRETSSGDLCVSCHYGKGNNGMELTHWQFTNKAHLEGKNFGNLEEVETAGIGIDLESYTCLSCHDDKSVVIPAENESAFEKAQRWRSMSDHPIGMDYARKALRKSLYYNDPLMLDKGIRLFNGRMGCGSCHNLYSNNKNNLAIPTDSQGNDGKLCLQCHIR